MFLANENLRNGPYAICWVYLLLMSLLRAASRNETQKNEQTNKRYRQTLQP
jgi:hypothetical protein